MNRCYLFQGAGSSDAPPTSLSREILWHNCSDVIHRRCVGSSGSEDPVAKSSLLASMRPSDRPMLPLDQGVGSSDAEDFVLARLFSIQTERQIDQRCPHSNRRIIWCYSLRCSSSATRPTLLENGSSVYPTVPRVSPSESTRPTIALTLAIWISSVHPTVCFLFLSCSVLTLEK
jgi:hypothetical protein